MIFLREGEYNNSPPNPLSFKNENLERNTNDFTKRGGVYRLSAPPLLGKSNLQIVKNCNKQERGSGGELSASAREGVGG